MQDLLSIFGRELLKFLRKPRTGREDGCARRRVVDDVHDAAAGAAVLLQQGGDGFAGGRDVGHGQLALGVFVLGVDDDEGAVGGRSR